MRSLFSKLLLGTSGGLIAGAIVGLVEATYILSSGSPGEYVALFYAVVLYGIIGAGIGCACGGGVWVVSLIFKKLSNALAYTLPFIGVIVSMGVVITLYVANKALYGEEGVPSGAKLKILAIYGVWSLLALWLGPIFLTRTPLKVLLRVRGTLAMYSGIAILSAIFAFAPGEESPTGILAPQVEQPMDLATRPNVMLIMVDTLRQDFLGTYNPEMIGVSPNIDAMAADSVVFEEGYAAASWTRASIASLFTSMVPVSHNTALKTSILPDEVDTIAEMMHERGYVTGGLPNNINVTRSFNFQQGFDYYAYQEPRYPFGATESAFQLSMYQVVRKVRERLMPHKDVAEFYQPADVVLANTREFIEAQGDNKWFSFVHLMEPHDPYFEHPYNGIGYGRAEHEVPDETEVVNGLPLIEYLKGVYRDEITNMDTHLGEMFDWMRETGRYDNTVIILTSDHGEEFFEHGGWWHGTTLYDEQIKVPLIVKRPSQANAGVHVPWQVRVIDIAPTISHATGANISPLWQGIQLFDQSFEDGLRVMNGETIGLVEGEGELARGEDGSAEDSEDPSAVAPVGPDFAPMERVVFAQEDFEGNQLDAIRVGGWKLITANDGNPRGLAVREMYQVAQDEGEENNLVGMHSEQQAELEDGIQRQIEEAMTISVEAADTELSPEDIARMRALGYME